MTLHGWGSFLYSETDREHSSWDVGNQHESSGSQCCFKPEVPQYAGKTHSGYPKSRGLAGNMSGRGRNRDTALKFTG